MSSSSPSSKRNVSPTCHVRSAATSMPVPTARKQPPPPPLPPPKHLPDLSAGHDPGWQWANFLHYHAADPSLKQPDSRNVLLTKPSPRDEPDSPFACFRRTSSLSTATLDPMSDDGRVNGDSDAIPPRANPNTELTGERDLRQRAIEQSSQSYDKQLVNRIGGPNTPKRQSIPYSPSIAQENGLGLDRRSSSVWSLTMPERRHLSVDSTATPRWPAGAVSPRSTSPWMEQDMFEGSRSASSQQNGSLAFEYGGSQRGSYDYSMFVHDVPQPEDGQMSSLNLHDTSPGSPKAGSKRRASSPPRERTDRSSLSSTSGQQELPHRHSIQTISSRTSPSSRFHPNHSSLSSVSSGPRHGSMGSSLGPSSIPSSATSYTSGGISPCQPSPAQDIDSLSMNHGLVPNSYSARHQRTPSDNTPAIARKVSAESISHSCAASLPNAQGVYVCECCPKKPVKFENEEDLKYHENEKQYTCAYCKKRFKNKNEAERHQNSVHLRRQSWCCAALSGVEAAFHPSSSTAYSADVCGYCGQEFPNPPAWDVRADHLSHAHKFGECNQSKKFYRADHFRQHLKHSHHGTSGKWTNVLENACVKYELATPGGTEKRVSPVSAATTSTAPPALMVTTTGLPAPVGPPAHPPAPPDTIEETPHDS